MRHHRAYGRPIDSLDVVVVDDAKPMQTILRSVLLAAKVARVRCFDSAEEALGAMMVDPPSLAVVDWRMRPTDGLKLVRTMRQATAGPLALVPVILITAHPTRDLVRQAIASGIHSVVAKPFSPATLIGRIRAIIGDGRRFEIESDGRVRLQGDESLLAAQSGRWNSMHGLPRPDDVLTLEPPEPAGRERRRPAVPVDMPYLPHDLRVAAAEERASEAAKPAFAAVRRGVSRTATGQPGPEAP